MDEDETVKKIRRIYWLWRQGDSLFQDAWLTMFNVHSTECLLTSARRDFQLWKSEERNTWVEREGELSVLFSCSAVSDSLRPRGLQHTRLPCPSPIPGVYSNAYPWAGDAISAGWMTALADPIRSSGAEQQFYKDQSLYLCCSGKGEKGSGWVCSLQLRLPLEGFSAGNCLAPAHTPTINPFLEWEYANHRSCAKVCIYVEIKFGGSL